MKFDSEVGVESGGLIVYTGLAPCKIVAINPPVEKLTEIIGDAASKFNTTYAMKEDNLNPGEMVRPVTFWIQPVVEGVETSPTPITVNLGEEGVASKKGSQKIINDHVQYTWGTDPKTITDNPRMEWFSGTGIRQARKGEIEYYVILDAFLKYKHEQGTNFTKECVENKLDFDTVLTGDFSGLHDFVEYINKLDQGAIFLFAAREKTEGRYVQNVIIRPELIFRTNAVKEWQKGKVIELHNEAIERGAHMSSSLFTTEFTEFEKEACVNYEGVAGTNQQVPDDEDW